MVKETGRSGLYRNTVSYLGGLIILISAALIILFLLLSFSLRTPSPYIGILTYMVFPLFLILGVVIFMIGLIREVRRRRRIRTEEPLPFPSFDLNEPRQRKMFGIVLGAGCLAAILFAFVGYNAYLFTDSNTFCGRLCHSVMKPEYTAYLNGPHARVPCVDCHVGSGVSWYVKSKLSGAPQVMAVWFKTYSRPIPVPLENLRPARETCNECHWPEKFYGAQLIQNPYFRYNEKNTPEQISLLIRTGGGTPNLGENAGIHWHMAIGHRVRFKAMDRHLQQIPWIEIEDGQGSRVVYRDKTIQVSEEQLSALPINTMDCMDCHNRPSHVFVPPEVAVDQDMAGGNISPRLPWIKKLGVDALVRNYDSGGNVRDQLRQFIEGFYAKEYPQVLRNQAGLLDQAIHALSLIYDRNVFPEMNVNWVTYPNNIGHRNWPGCFRCHNDRHVNEAGKVLTSSCPVCHTVPQRGPLLPLGATSPSSAEPWHPWPLKGKHAKILCNLCHRAGYRPPLECTSCHRISTSAPMMSMACSQCHTKEAETTAMVSCKSCHPVQLGLHRNTGHSPLPCSSCHIPHVWTVTKRETCLACHEDRKDHNPSGLCGDCHPFKKA